MRIIINNNSMIPIYEQIFDQIKQMIIDEELIENSPLPSVRSLAKDLKISALTVKKAYDLLESEGFSTTVHGKGSYVLKVNSNVIKEEMIKNIQDDFDKTIVKAKLSGLSKDEIIELFNILIEETI